jgi:ATP-binding cassette subfamily F protein uup
LGKVTRCAYLDQFRSGLDEAKSVVDDVGRGRTQINVGGRSIDLRSYLQMFAIEGEQLRKTVAELSGGERARVALAKLLSQEVNLMVLDEPTNDLDVVTLSAVESMLLEFGGTSIVVTHDRHFLDRVATSIWAFEGDRIGVYEGDYSRYRSRQGEATALAVVVPEVRPPAQPDKADRGGLTYGETRELRRLEQEIEDTERQIAELEQRLADPTGLQLEALRELSETFGERQLVLQTLIARWEHLEAKRG